MAFSPRKRARATFDPTWSETDAAFLQPTSLPVNKVPRAWERKPETTMTRDGKQRKVWRRYGLRSQAVGTNEQTETDDGEDNTSPDRAVKKLRVRPDEVSDESHSTKKKPRSFKATRWDRRKSALPRKMPTHHDAQDESIVALRHEPADELPDAPEESFATEVEGDDSQVSLSASLIPAKDLLPSLDTTAETAGTPNNSSMETDKDEAGLDVSSPLRLQYEQNAFEKSECPPTPRPNSETIGARSNEDGYPGTSSETPSLEVQPSVVTSAGVDGPSSPDLIGSSPGPEGDNMEHNDTPERDTNGEDIHNSAEGQVTAETALPFAGTLHNPPRDSHLSSVATGGSQENHVTHPYVSPDKTMCELNEEPQDSLSSEVQPTESGDQHPDATSTDPVASKNEYLDSLNVGGDVEMLSAAGEGDSLGSSAVAESPVPFTVETDTESLSITEDHPTDVETESTSHVTERDEAAPTTEPPAAVESPNVSGDITDGLTLAFSTSGPTEAQADPLKSLQPNSVGGVNGSALMQLDEDTAILKDFLTRSAATKASKAATIARRESLQNRRDSGAIRQALASPRKILEDKDPNSPKKSEDNTVTLDIASEPTLDLDDTMTLSAPADQPEGEANDEATAGRGARRSARTRKSRIPHLPSTSQQTPGPKNIALRRADGSEPVVLRKTEAQELALLTRNNTRKNKQGAVAVPLRLMKLVPETARMSSAERETGPEERPTKIKWDEQLEYFQDGSTDSSAPDEGDSAVDGVPEDGPTKAKGKVKEKYSKEAEKETSTPRVRRLRGLGAQNGTPAKGLLSSTSLLPADVQEEKESAEEKKSAKPSKVKKTFGKLATPRPIDPSAFTASLTESLMDSLPVADSTASGPKLITESVSPKGKPASKERKSRLATPRKVKLPQPSKTLAAAPPAAALPPVEGKENRGLVSVNPKKGLPAPQVVVPTAVITPTETGTTGTALPRRRGARRG